MNKRRAALILARRYLNKPRLKQLTIGDLNTTYLASDGENKFIIRIAEKTSFGERYLPTFIKSAKAADAVRRAGLPAGQVLLSGDELVPYAYQVVEYIDGETADQFPGPKTGIWHQVGKAARRINQIHPNGIGETPFEAGSQSWNDYIDNKIKQVIGFHRSPNRDLVKRGHVFELWELNIFERLMQPIRTSDEPLGLTHSDLGLHNVLINPKGEVIGIIDWDHAKAFPAAHQIAVSTFWNSYRDKHAQACRIAFLEGYGQKVDPDLVRAYQLYEFLSQLPFHTYKSSVRQMLRLVAGISTVADSLSSESAPQTVPAKLLR